MYGREERLLQGFGWETLGKGTASFSSNSFCGAGGNPPNALQPYSLHGTVLLES
jgi:hypothetical protein